MIENNTELNKLLYKSTEFADNRNLCDSIVFHEIIKIADAVVGTFGKYCEAVVHDLRKPEASIIYVAGNVTNRKIGGPVTNFVLEKLRNYGNSCEDSIGYKNVTQDGNILKSSTIYIRNFKDEIIGSLCINYNITTLISHLEQITTFDNLNNPKENTEFFPTDVVEILDTIFNQIITTKGISVEDMNKKDKMEIVGLLDIKGVFLIKGSVDKVALALGVSRYTIYNYLEQNRSQRKALR